MRTLKRTKRKTTRKNGKQYRSNRSPFSCKNNKQAQIYVVDYANVLHILYNHFHNVDQVILHFYRFLHTQTQHNNMVFLIAKPVKLNNVVVDLSTLLKAGKKQSHFTVDQKKLYVYNLTFANEGSRTSSVDDLVFWLVAIYLFTELLVQGKQPQKVLRLLSNDKQYFNKIIFQLSTQDLKELRLTTLDASGLHEVKSPLEGRMKKNLKALMTPDNRGPANLECTIKHIVPQLPVKMAEILDYAPCGDIKELNEKQIYIYAWIKYIQMQLYGDIYGSLPQDAILKLFI